MKIYAFICTRSKDLSDTTKKLVSYLSSCNIDTKLLVDSESIFSGYKRAFENTNPEDEDIIILCHDDIEILSTKENFGKAINKLADPKVGFVGPAGTTCLSKDAVWWNHDNWRQGKHRGLVFHGESLDKSESTYYGQSDRVVVLDGLFLAAKAKVLKDIKLDKPDYLEGEWDFYDIHYTYTAHTKGYENYVVPLLILHNSFGELVGRESWHNNRERFIKRQKLPMEIK